MCVRRMSQGTARLTTPQPADSIDSFCLMSCLICVELCIGLLDAGPAKWILDTRELERVFYLQVPPIYALGTAAGASVPLPPPVGPV